MRAALVACYCLLLAGCVAPAEAVDQAAREAAIAHADAVDETLTLETRQLAADEQRAWCAQYGACTNGDAVPGSAAWDPLPAELAPVPAGGAPRK